MQFPKIEPFPNYLYVVLHGLDVQADASGVATFSAINVTGTAGARTFTISGTGLTSATTAAITFN